MKKPIINRYYKRYLGNENTDAFRKSVLRHYTPGTLERLLSHGSRIPRRAAALALGIVGDYEANTCLGQALCDKDRVVRVLAENSIRQVWCRMGNASHRSRLASIIRLNTSQKFTGAIEKATALLDEAPWFAEVWNQRAIAHFSVNHFHDSIRDCHQALELNPYHFGSAAGMGQSYLELNDAHAALECFRRALKLNPNMDGVRAQVAYLQKTLEGM